MLRIYECVTNQHDLRIMVLALLLLFLWSHQLPPSWVSARLVADRSMRSYLASRRWNCDRYWDLDDAFCSNAGI